MADEEQGEGRIRHVGENVQLNGRPLRRGDSLAPGTLVVTHVYRRGDGSEIAAPMQFTIDPDMFREELQIVIKSILSEMEVGQPFVVEFDVVSGSAPAFMPLFSSEGDAQDKFQYFLPNPLAGNVRRFVFTAPDVESTDCYLVVGGYASDGKPLGFSPRVGPFAIRKPSVRDQVVIDPIKPEVQVGERVPVTFTVTTSKTIDRFEVSYYSTKRNIPYTPLLPGALAGDVRAFTFEAPDVEADDFVIVVVPYDQMTGRPMQFGRSNPIKITKKGGAGPGPSPPPGGGTDGEGVQQDLPVIEDLLRRGLSLPKRPLFANRNKKTLNVAQFASEAVFSDKSVLRDEIKKKIPVVIGRLEDLKNELDASGYQSQNPRNYDQFMKIFLDIEAKKKHFLQLNDPKEFVDLQGMCAYGFERVKEKPEFAEIFDKNFATPLDKHEWPMLYRDPEKLAFLFRQRDTVGVTAIQHLYRFFDVLYDYLFQLDASFTQMKKVLSQVRKDLGI